MAVQGLHLPAYRHFEVMAVNKSDGGGRRRRLDDGSRTSNSSGKTTATNNSYPTNKIIVNHTDCVTCDYDNNYGQTTKEFVTNGLPHQCVAMETCGDTLTDTIQQAGVIKEVEEGDTTFSKRVMSGLSDASSFLAAGGSGSGDVNGFAEGFEGMERLLRAMEPTLMADGSTRLMDLK